VAQTYDKSRMSGRLGVAKYDNIRMSGRLGAQNRKKYVCLENWENKKTTKYVCLEGSVWQSMQFDCKCMYVWRLSGRLVAQKYDKFHMSGRLGVAKYAI
jgi:hypothetical protein